MEGSKVKMDERVAAKKLREDGLSLREISEKLNVSKASVSLWVRDVMVSEDLLARRGQLKGERLLSFYENQIIDDLKLRSYVDKKLSLLTISRKTKCSIGCLKHWIGKLGLVLERVGRAYDRCQLCNKENGIIRSKYCNTCTSRIRRYKNKISAVEYKGGKCEICNRSFDVLEYSAFEFHHCDANKEIEIGTALNRKWGIIKEEIKKCLLLCSSCHKIEHSKYDQRLYEETKKYLIV